MYMITGSGSTAIQQRFSYDAAGNLVAVVYKVGSGTSYIYYYLRNAQGDIVKLIDSSGNTVVEYLYDSWGKIIATTGSLANTVGANQPFRYRGYVYDEETGWYYLQSRYYDPTTCRFISADVLLSTGQGVIGHNSFAYCNNDPINMFDNDGTAPWPTTAVVNDGARNTGYKDWKSLYYEAKRMDKYICEALYGNLHPFVTIKECNEAQFRIKDCASAIIKHVQKGRLDELCNYIASTILSKHKAKFGKSFFATKAQLSRETKEHIVGYLWANGVKGYSCPLAFKVYYNYLAKDRNGLSLRAYVLRKCNSAEYCLNSLGENIWYYGKFSRGGI